MDKTRDGSLDNFEVYSLFTAWDSNKDYSVSTNELLSWMLKNEDAICKPYEKEIHKMMKKMKKMKKGKK
jgi:Ca2+-binding EF-hand superfamily protein